MFKFNKGVFTVFPGLCKGCGLCIQKCPKNSLGWSKVLGIYGTPSVEPDENCIACGICAAVCPDCAILIGRNGQGPPARKDLGTKPLKEEPHEERPLH
ncbi:MAG: 4Fe-4S binding protein [Bacillota bacterium]|nr:4Fe-4S binding protein [Bacillota bacterium]